MKYLKFTFVLLFLLSSIIFAQSKQEDFVKAYPLIGWDSLRSIIERLENYPEILRRLECMETYMFLY